MNTRSYCPNCDYPTRTCLCNYVKTIDCVTQFEILQHPLETKAAKNTARLIKLCMPNTRIWVGESPNDFLLLKKTMASDPKLTYIVYPSDSAVSEKAIAPSNSTLGTASLRILLIDATWRKALKLWALNSWLHEYTHIKLEDVPSRYRIRKSPKSYGLSTLECAEHILSLTEPHLNTRALTDCFEALQSHYPHPTSKTK